MRWILSSGLFAGLSTIALSPGSIAQIVPDTTFGSERSTVRPEIVRDLPSALISGGAIRGSNLFHSFSSFNIPEGGGAYFVNPDAIRNIFARVMGERSQISGRLGVLGDANLFLINPNGVVFEQNSSLDVGGSLVVTTADAMQFGDRGIFSATAPGSPASVLTVDPSAFVFNRVPTGAIVNQSIAPARRDLSDSFDLFGLRVQEGRSLLFLGGNINIDQGGIVAPGGRIDLAGVQGTGTVELANSGNTLKLNLPDSVSRADVILTNGAGITVAGRGGGDIAIQARNLDVLQGSSIEAGISPNLTAIVPSGDITINATNQVTVNDSFVENLVFPNATGNAGNINIFAPSLIATNGGQISSSVERNGNGNAGMIAIQVSDRIFVNGASDRGFISGIFANLLGNGNTGGIEITTGDMTITNGAQFISDVRQGGKGNVGGVRITAARGLTLDGEGPNFTSTDFFPSAIFSGVQAGGEGNSNGISVKAGSLSVTNRAQISSTTKGQGNAGNIAIEAQDQVLLLNSLIISEVTEGQGQGNGGDIRIKTGSLIVRDGSALLADTESQGNAGNIIINADSITLDGKGPAARDRDVIVPNQISTTVEGDAIGQGGAIEITARSIAMTDSAFISSKTFGQGDAGNITVTTDTLTMRNGAVFEAATESSNSAGSIFISARDFIDISGFADGFVSGAFASTEIGEGKGGNITLLTNTFSLSDRARISAQSLGSGSAGSINIRANDRFNITDSTIRTSATDSSGGAISIRSERVRLQGDSEISSAVESGANGGGDIRIDAGYILAQDNSDIFAASRDGQGGDITLSGAYFGIGFQLSSLTERDLDRLRNNDRPDINATGSRPGVVTGFDRNTIQNSLTQLSQSSIDTQTLIANSCISRDRSTGAFFIKGKGGLPIRPGDLPLSPYTTGTIQAPTSQTPNRGDPTLEPQAAYRLPDGKILLSRECSN